ncbi:MAG: hypothetical protein HFF18_02560 [Oscillospiraceae bacterium]|nr:hypothetical protein [Oscillospiraceae bacterium]
MSKFEDMSSEELRRNYVPGVYQHSIYSIDYQKLKDAGIRLLSFDIDGTIAEAKKPFSKNFQKLQDRFGLEKSQMAHVGNSQMDGVAGGNAVGVTTCLVRRVGKATKVVNAAKKRPSGRGAEAA